MKSVCSTLALSSLIVLATGCFGGGGGGGGGEESTAVISAYSCYSDIKVSGSDVSGTFCDGAITNGSQVSKIQKSFLEMIWGKAGIPNAYASAVNEIPINCEVGDSLELDVTLMGSVDTTIEVTCNAQIDLQIRRELVQAFQGQELIAEYSGGGSVLDQGRIIDFTDFGPSDSILDADVSSFPGLNEVREGDDHDVCRNAYTFTSTGEVRIELNTVASNANGSGNVTIPFEGSVANSQYCYNSEGKFYLVMDTDNGDGIGYNIENELASNSGETFLNNWRDQPANRSTLESAIHSQLVNSSSGAGLTTANTKVVMACSREGYKLYDASIMPFGAWREASVAEYNSMTPEEKESAPHTFIESCSEEHYTQQVGFRFRDGFIEMDFEKESNGSYAFSDGVNLADTNSAKIANRKLLKNYSRFCIKGSGNTCNTGAYNNYRALPEI